jgi:hypothetical protein
MGDFYPMRSLFVYPSPEPGALMAVLKAYFDDSTAFDSAQKPQLLTVGGYLSDVDSWGRFEVDWRNTLAWANVPYLHMKEFWDNDGIYKHIKDDPQKEELFFRRLVRPIKDHTKFCTQTTILLEDLTRFNLDNGLNLSAPALGVYGCLLALQFQFPNGEIEAIFDKFEQAGSVLEKAKAYLHSDVSAQPEPGNKANPFLSIHPLERADSWRTILPMQAADWLSWEMRKTCIDTQPWIAQKGMNPSIDWVRDFHKWASNFSEEKGRPFRNRKSFIALREANMPQGHIWNYEQLGIVKERHPHGWALRNSSDGIIQLFTPK